MYLTNESWCNQQGGVGRMSDFSWRSLWISSYPDMENTPPPPHHPSPPIQLLRVDLTTREGRSFQINRGVFEYCLSGYGKQIFPHHSPEILKNQKYVFSNHKY